VSARHIYKSAILLIGSLLFWSVQGQGQDAEAEKLKSEVASKGWLLFSQRTEAGDYDLFISRPDGSAKRNLTHSPEWVEFGGRFSPDGKRMMYRRLPKLGDSKRGLINHDLWGSLGSLCIANSDGSNPQQIGESGGWPWACWSPDGKQISCLYKREGKIQLFDLETKKLLKVIPRQGIFQQLYWSGDGKRLCGTANLNGQDWNIVSIELDSGKLTQLSRDLCCTPDWFQGDANRVIYSCRIPGVGGEYGWTMLMQATVDGKSRTLIYGERGRHIYYGCTSPDDKYVVFGVPASDGGVDAEMALVRLEDTPMVVPDDYKGLKALYPEAKGGPMVRLGQAGFEPHWTYAEIESK
jgi:Tol biopolymer transport system component